MFLVKNFPVGQRVLVDSSFGQPTTQGEARKEEATRQGELPLVKEVLLVALGSRQSRPYLLVSTGRAPRPHPGPALSRPLMTRHHPQVHVDQELLIYEAFAHDSQLGQGNLKVRFKKVRGWPRGPGQGGGRAGAHGTRLHQVPHNINFREKKPKLSKKKAEGGGAEEGAAARGRVARFRYFEDIYGYSGVGRGPGTGRPSGGARPRRLLMVLPPGLHLWAFTSLASGDQPGGPAAAPHGHRRPHRLLRPVPQRQLPPRLPVLQQTGSCQVGLPGSVGAGPGTRPW